MCMAPREQKEEILRWAKAEGLVAGIASVAADLRAEYFRKWIAEGQHAGMKWMDNYKRIIPRAVMPEVRSVVVVGMNYYQTPPEREGKISLYAQGEDYHKVLLEKLKRLCAVMEAWGGLQKPYVDTGPVLEKRFGVAAGLGWQGKNTVLISPEYGTWLFLGVILTTLELPSDKPMPDRCGSCTRCMSACPTGAITAPHQLDARKCFEYWTVEHKGEFPEEFHAAIGDRLFGCDDCLSVCPWNKFAKESHEMRLKAKAYPSATEILTMDEAGFEKTFAGTPIERLGLERLKRNARIVVANGKVKLT